VEGNRRSSVKVLREHVGGGAEENCEKLPLGKSVAVPPEHSASGTSFLAVKKERAFAQLNEFGRTCSMDGRETTYT
jgi:hypothetical protein